MAVYDDEIDLRPYILTLINRWRLIGLLAILAAGAAFAASILQPRSYEATAKILVTRSRTALALAEQFPTVAEPVDARSRMEAMLSITEGDALALATLRSVESSLPPDERELVDFKERVEVTDNGDLILVTAKARDPALAAEIANAWARQAVDDINVAYSGEQPPAEIQGQRQASQQEYEQAQAALEDFIQHSQLPLLGKKIAETSALLSGLADERARRIEFYASLRLQLDQLIVQAEGLKTQLQSGSRSAAGGLGDALAVLMARASALDLSSAGQPVSAIPGLTLNLQFAEIDGLQDTAANHTADLESLIELAQAERSRAEASLQALKEEVEQEQGYDQIALIAARLQDLATQQENELARQRELSSQRDLAWQAYQAISQKEVEIKNAAQTTNRVTLASLAILPERPAPRGTVRNTLVAGVLGLVLGLAWVIGAHWWREFKETGDKGISEQATRGSGNR